MFYAEAEKTRELLKTVGARAFQCMDYDAISAMSQQAERYLAAVATEATDELLTIQEVLLGWQRFLERLPPG